MDGQAYMHIGELSARVGISADLLRAWERRYGVPQPARSSSGVRLYTPADEQTVRSMSRAIATGIPASDAARLARGTVAPPVRDTARRDLGALAERLAKAVSQLDEGGAQAELDLLFGVYGVDTALSRVVLPLMRQVGERWACAEIGVGDEHFVSTLIEGRLLSLARNWNEGSGPHALLACPAGEQHTIGLLAFGLALRMQGWRITYLGADTPIAAVAHVAEAVHPDQVVLSSVSGDVWRRAHDGLVELSGRVPVALGGAGAAAKSAARSGAVLLSGDAVAEAARLATPAV